MPDGWVEPPAAARNGSGSSGSANGCSGRNGGRSNEAESATHDAEGRPYQVTPKTPQNSFSHAPARPLARTHTHVR